MQENLELRDTDKIKLKMVSAQKVTHMKDLILKEAHEIVENNETVPRTERVELPHRTSLIIKVDDDFKEEIKTFCDVHSIRIRDFWVECVRRVNWGWDNETKESF